MFTISPIGSCRVTTPLRKGQDRHGFHLNLDRCYGYCHSPAEAVQMAKFMQGDANIPQDIWPLVSRNNTLEEYASQHHETSDLYVVELASAKEVSIDGVSVQLNYLNAAFPDFFADTERTQAFWEIAETGTPAAVTAFLSDHWSETEQQREDARTLSRMRLHIVTEDSLRQDIETLVDVLPDVLFVSHIDARKSDGNPIRSRSAFIDMVSREAERAGCQFYNPTLLMKEFGQAGAIEDESTSLAHFTDAFAAGIMGDWMRDVISPKTDAEIANAAAPAVDLTLKPQILAACENGAYVDARARLQSLSSKGADVASLLSDTVEKQAQASAAFDADHALTDMADLDVDSREMLALIAAGLGRFEDALHIADPTAAVTSDRALMQLGDLAVKARDVDAALASFVPAAKRGQPRALRKIGELAIEHDKDVLSQLAPSDRGAFLASLPADQRLSLLQLNGASFTQAVTDTSDAAEVNEIIAQLSSTHGIGYAAEVLAHWRMMHDTDRVTDSALCAALDAWVDIALAFETRIDRIHGINAVLYAAPRHGAARRAMQELRNTLALHIREAGKDDDIDLLDALSDEAAALTRELPELDLWRARLRFARGEFEAAIHLGQSAAAHMPNKINVWVLLMRAATKSQRPADASTFARRVIALTTAETQALKAEAEALLRPDLAVV